MVCLFNSSDGLGASRKLPFYIVVAAAEMSCKVDLRYTGQLARLTACLLY
jgi:hypothetical protein